MELPMGWGAGRDGASVAYHPIQKKYYAAMTGGGSSPLLVFDEQGKRIDSTNTELDMRGLWYNENTRSLEGNAKDPAGWFDLEIDLNGKPQKTIPKFDKTAVPELQCVGTYLPRRNYVLFFTGGTIHIYNPENGGFVDHFQIEEPAQEPTIQLDDAGPKYTDLIIFCTPEAGKEIGVLNLRKKAIEMYSIEEGKIAYTLYLPAGQPMYGAFNGAYANGMFWLFDQQRRVWNGYK